MQVTERKVKVAQIITRLGAGGPPIYVLALHRELARKGAEVVLCHGSCSEQDLDMSYLIMNNDNVAVFPEMSRRVSIRDVRALAQLVRFMWKIRPVIVHTHTAKAGALGRIAARIAGVPVVVHTFHGNVFRGYFSPGVTRVVRSIERALGKITNRVFVVCRQQQQEIVNHFQIVPDAKVAVSPLVVDFARTPTILPISGKGSPLVVGWFGRLVDVKNVPLLCSIIREAWKQSGGDGKLRFVIAGDGPLRYLIEELASQVGGDLVTYLGWVQDLYPVIKKCDILLQTSKNEGTPLALIEGMTCGRAFVATPVGGVLDLSTGKPIHEADGIVRYDNAYLISKNPERFVSVLNKLSADRNRVEAMGRSAREFSMNAFTPRGAFQKVFDVYMEELERVGLGTLSRAFVEPAQRPCELPNGQDFSEETSLTLDNPLASCGLSDLQRLATYVAAFKTKESAIEKQTLVQPPKASDPQMAAH